jgi:hypothetical protein
MENGQGFAPSHRQRFGVPPHRPESIDLTRVSKRARELASEKKCKPVRPKSMKVSRRNGFGFFETLFPVFMIAGIKKGG